MTSTRSDPLQSGQREGDDIIQRSSGFVNAPGTANRRHRETIGVATIAMEGVVPGPGLARGMFGTTTTAWKPGSGQIVGVGPSVEGGAGREVKLAEDVG
jgi:hypothetical protein